jgi:mono/diheme cytochrome c family protein
VRTPVLLVLLATSPVRADEPLSTRERGDLAIGARAILRKYCSECHGAGEKAKQGTVNVLEHPRLLAKGPNPVPFVAPKNAAGSQIVQLIEDGSMPPGGRQRPTAGEIDTLKKWIAAEAPGFPVKFDEESTLKILLDDLSNRPADALHLRYVSFSHLVGDGSPPDLKSKETSLFAALKVCGIENPPQPVDGAATIYRFDVRQAGWDNRELFYQTNKGAKDDIYQLTPFDLILLEYPHGTTLPADNPLFPRLNEYVMAARLARPIPYMRGDWVAAQLEKGTPLADDLRSLTELDAALAKEDNPVLGREKNMPCGTASRAFAARNPVPAAPNTKPTLGSSILPLSARYSGDCQAETPPFDLKAEPIGENEEPVTTVPTRTGFNLRVTSDRDVHFVLLMVWSDGSIHVQQTNTRGFLKAGKSVLAMSDGKPFKISGILTGEPTATEYFVLLASQSELPAVIIVRSRHAANPDCDEKKRFPVYRFLFDTAAKFDSAAVVRRVVPITVIAKK